MQQLPRTPEEAVQAYDDAFNARDWDALGRLVIAEMHIDDRRTGLTGTLEDRDAHVSNHKAWHSLVPDVLGMSDIIRTTARFTVWRTLYRGTDQYKNPVDVVIVVLNEWTTDEDGALLSKRGAIYNEDQLDVALTEYERLVAEAR